MSLLGQSQKRCDRLLLAKSNAGFSAERFISLGDGILSASSPSQALARQLSQRESPWQCGEGLRLTGNAGVTGPVKSSPFGRAAERSEAERARPLTISRRAHSVNGTERSMTYLRVPYTDPQPVYGTPVLCTAF